MTPIDPNSSLSGFGVEEVRKNSQWYFWLGVILIVLGTFAVGVPWVVTGSLVVIFGALMLVAGGLQAGHAFMRKAWGGFFLDLFVGLLYAVVGILVLTRPFAAAAVITLLIAVSLILGGVFRIVAAISIRPPHWIVVLLNGAVGLVLGILIAAQWPLSGIWVIGLFVGIDLIFSGFSLIFLSSAVSDSAAGSGGDGGEPAAAT